MNEGCWTVGGDQVVFRRRKRTRRRGKARRTRMRRRRQKIKDSGFSSTVASTSRQNMRIKMMTVMRKIEDGMDDYDE